MENTAQWEMEVWKEAWSEGQQEETSHWEWRKQWGESRNTSDNPIEHKIPLEESKSMLHWGSWYERQAWSLIRNPSYIYSNSSTKRLEKSKVMSTSKHKNCLLQSLLNCARYPVFNNKKITGQMKRHMGSFLLD